MKFINLAVLFVLILSGSVFGDESEIATIRAEYTQYGLKVPDADMFGTSHSSRYFSANEIGNPNDCYANFLANTMFWWMMDELRSLTGPIVISSGYRPPTYNRNLRDSDGNPIPSDDRSLHQYGAGTDATRIGGVYWVNMTEAQKDALFVQIGVAATAMQSKYGEQYYIDAHEKDDHLHLELMNYCDFDDNWL